MTLAPTVESVFKQWLWFPLLQPCVTAMTLIPTVAKMCSNNDSGSRRLPSSYENVTERKTCTVYFIHTKSVKNT
jgi:hypothetical protein